MQAKINKILKDEEKAKKILNEKLKEQEFIRVMMDQKMKHQMMVRQSQNDKAKAEQQKRHMFEAERLQQKAILAQANKEANAKKQLESQMVKEQKRKIANDIKKAQEDQFLQKQQMYQKIKADKAAAQNSKFNATMNQMHNTNARYDNKVQNKRNQADSFAKKTKELQALEAEFQRRVA